jgi:hypothetical protein
MCTFQVVLVVVMVPSQVWLWWWWCVVGLWQEAAMAAESLRRANTCRFGLRMSQPGSTAPVSEARRLI